MRGRASADVRVGGITGQHFLLLRYHCTRSVTFCLPRLPSLADCNLPFLPHHTLLTFPPPIPPSLHTLILP